ncbi:hypothetical protein BpHYR1_050086 [Brachionus plicatilis]|uniref:Uncharacterized protein n=1 Tax=Brachionus plicatilis TaxID=10195 RepID=A0A3M7R7V1_BRAPC|nr:hypothetical protein BpHYR1_050086 [Brachionus plicatilis]
MSHNLTICYYFLSGLGESVFSNFSVNVIYAFYGVNAHHVKKSRYFRRLFDVFCFSKDLLKLVPENSNFKELWKKAGDSFKNDKNKKNKIS